MCLSVGDNPHVTSRLCRNELGSTHIFSKIISESYLRSVRSSTINFLLITMFTFVSCMYVTSG